MTSASLNTASWGYGIGFGTANLPITNALDSNTSNIHTGNLTNSDADQTPAPIYVLFGQISNEIDTSVLQALYKSQKFTINSSVNTTQTEEKKMTNTIINKAINVTVSESISCQNLRQPAIYEQQESILVIGSNLALSIEDCLNDGSVTVKTHNSIIIDSSITWTTQNNLNLVSLGNITLAKDAKITGCGEMNFKAGIESKVGVERVFFEGSEEQIYMSCKNKVIFHYNPDKGMEEHRYQNPKGYFIHVKPMTAEISYMLVNDVNDLQNINYFLAGNYALSQNIDAQETALWNENSGFSPLIIGLENSKGQLEYMSFRGAFNGNDYTISNLFINNDMHNIGLFSRTSGTPKKYALVCNVKLQNFFIKGEYAVGGVVGDAEYTRIQNVQIINSSITTRDLGGSIIGRGSGVELINILSTNNVIESEDIKGEIAGVLRDSYLKNVSYTNDKVCCTSDEEFTSECVGKMYKSICEAL